MVHPKRLLAAVSTVLAVATWVPPAGAATLKDLLDEVSGDTPAPCLETITTTAVPVTRPTGRCAADTVAQLYLRLLRDRARLAVVRDAVAYHRQALEAQRSRLEGGGSSEVEVNKVNVEFHRWQLREVEVTHEVRSAEVFFIHVMTRDPTEFVDPTPDEAAWPADEAAALAALDARLRLSVDERGLAEVALQRAWIDYESVQREVTLLEPMKAFAVDVLAASERGYEVSQVSLGTLLDLASDRFELEEAYLAAGTRRLLLQVRVLELLGRRDALD